MFSETSAVIRKEAKGRKHESPSVHQMFFIISILHPRSVFTLTWGKTICRVLQHSWRWHRGSLHRIPEFLYFLSAKPGAQPLAFFHHVYRGSGITPPCCYEEKKKLIQQSNQNMPKIEKHFINFHYFKKKNSCSLSWVLKNRP